MWYKNLAKWIENRGGLRKIYRKEGDRSVLYLERFYILKTPFCEIMLHRFHCGDDAVMHDHPWDSCNIILETGYNEHVINEWNEEEVHFRAPGYFGYRSAEGQHWVELLPNTSGHVWTLFMTMRRRKEWGFFTKEGYMDSQEYGKKIGVDEVNTRSVQYKGWLFPKKSN